SRNHHHPQYVPFSLLLQYSNPRVSSGHLWHSQWQ
ncbi:hypothetical protein TrRE_jg3214, partial [Triparma retinervis]